MEFLSHVKYYGYLLWFPEIFIVDQEGHNCFSVEKNLTLIPAQVDQKGHLRIRQ